MQKKIIKVFSCFTEFESVSHRILSMFLIYYVILMTSSELCLFFKININIFLTL